jgi:hypothetical protein
MKSLRNIGALIIFIGAILTLYFLVSTTSPVASLSDLLITVVFYVWVMLPFVVLFILTFSLHRKRHSPAARVAAFFTSILVVVPSVVLYWTVVFRPESSTSALAFLFLPFYALVAIAITYLLSWLVLRMFMSKA